MLVYWPRLFGQVHGGYSMRPLLVALMVGLGLGPLVMALAKDSSNVLDRPAQIAPLATRSLLTSVARAGSRLVAVGERGHIITSSDNGLTWTQSAVPVSVTLTAVQFVDAKNGWAVGHDGVILHSVDGGASWKKQLDGRELVHLFDLYAADKDEATRRFAKQWSEDGPDKPLLALYFRDALNGLVVGAYGMFLQTVDGGEHWRLRLDRVDNVDHRHLNAIRPAKDALYMVGEQGTVYRGSGAEGQLLRLSSPYKGSFFDLLISPRGTLLALGLRGNLFRSDSEGKRWERVDLGSTRSLTQGAILDDGSLALVDEAGAVWVSHDDGHSFLKFDDPRAFPYAGLVQAANGSLVAVGARGFAVINPERAKVSAAVP